MDDFSIRVEPLCEDIKISCVFRLVSPEYGISDVVSDFYTAKSPRRYKHRTIHDISDHVPLSAKFSKLVSKFK